MPRPPYKDDKEYQAAAKQVQDEVIKELGLTGGAAEKFKSYTSDYLVRNFGGLDPTGRPQMSQADKVAWNNKFYSDMQPIGPGTPPEHNAYVSGVQSAMNKFNRRMEGPGILQQLFVDPFWTKEEGFKPAGVAGLVGGGALALGMQKLIAPTFEFGTIAKLAITAGMAISGAVVLGPLISKGFNALTGKNDAPDTAPDKRREMAQHTPERAAEQGVEMTQADVIPEHVRNQALDPNYQPAHPPVPSPDAFPPAPAAPTHPQPQSGRGFGANV